jgi:hypothetical protein
MELHGTREINRLNDGLERPIASDHGALSSTLICDQFIAFGNSLW